MLNVLFEMVRPAVFLLDPERAHELSLRTLEAGLYPSDTTPDDPRLAQTLFGLQFSNPLSIAAGYDKDARVMDAALDLGCGFAEVGTITPKPQQGNPTPRIFRLPADRAVINRLGFNNGGHAAALARLERRRGKRPIAVNIGANKDTGDKAADYVAGLDTFYDVASYFVVNISSPNTPGLRDLQAPAALDALLGRITSARAQRVAAGGVSRPIVVKIAPDIAEDDLAPIVERLIANKVDGIAVSNTTLARAGLRDGFTAKEAGGLSGRPLFHRSTVVLARVYQLTGGKIPLIGIGGIDSGETAIAKLEAGASLLQVYTGLIYEGPGLIRQIKRQLFDRIVGERLAGISALTGRNAAAWAAKAVDG